MQNHLPDFNTFVSDLVYYHIKMGNISASQLSEKIGLSYSFVQKVLSNPKNKHFNLTHIFLISQAIDLPVEKFLPSKENYKLLTNKELSEEEWKKFINYLKKERED